MEGNVQCRGQLCITKQQRKIADNKERESKIADSIAHVQNGATYRIAAQQPIAPAAIIWQRAWLKDP